jgi:hypothetical protein
MNNESSRSGSIRKTLSKNAVWLFLAPYTLAGFWLLYTGIIAVMLPICGQELPATVTDVYTWTRHSKGGQTREYAFDYTYPGSTGRHWSYVSYETYQSLLEGARQRVTVRLLPYLPSINNPKAYVDGRIDSDDVIGTICVLVIGTFLSGFALLIPLFRILGALRKLKSQYFR